jgi:RNA polymerase sigma factor (sigma-70 family)
MVDLEGIDMDVRLRGSQGDAPDTTQPLTASAGAGLEPGEITRILGQRQRRELRIARGFVECQGLSRQQLEDLYQETLLALLNRPYQNEKHLCDALRTGIKRRAMNLYRDEGRRAAILAESAPGIYALEVARSADERPEQVALARQDRLLITEFLAELTLEERRVFWLVTEGMKYNRIASVRGISVNEARNLVASCERKRERFQFLHDSGRLCGYRAQTIKKLLDGQASSEQLVQLAAAHLEACAHCRTEFKTNAQRLRKAFQDQAVALLPPAITSHLDGQTRLGSHARLLAARIRPDWVSLGQGGARERAAALLAGGGASVKLAAGIATVAVITTSTITATHALEHHQTRPLHHPKATASTAAHAIEPVALTEPSLPPVPRRATRSAPARRRPGRVVELAHQATKPSESNRREPGGFAYLGVPTHTTTPTPAPQPQAKAATHTGGPFSP